MLSPKQLALFALWILLWPDVTTANDLPFFIHANFVTLSTAVLLSTLPQLFNLNGLQHGTGTSPHIKRTRKSVCKIFAELGKCYVRRAYRMDETAFWRLCRLIRPYMSVQKPVSKGRGARKNNGAKTE